MRGALTHINVASYLCRQYVCERRRVELASAPLHSAVICQRRCHRSGLTAEVEPEQVHLYHLPAFDEAASELHMRERKRKAPWKSEHRE